MNYDDAGNKFNEIILENEESRVLNDVVDFLYKNFDKYSWLGIYIVRGDTLVLGPWKGKQATEHIQIPISSGVCGSAAKSSKTELVPDVNKDDRYLACFVSTHSEIVVSIKKKGEIDIDSDVPNASNNKDGIFLEKIASNEKFIGYVDKW